MRLGEPASACTADVVAREHRGAIAASSAGSAVDVVDSSRYSADDLSGCVAALGSVGGSLGGLTGSDISAHTRCSACCDNADGRDVTALRPRRAPTACGDGAVSDGGAN